MEWNSKEFFPTLFYEFNFSEEEIQPLLDEMEEKKKIIKYKYIHEYAVDRVDRVIDYWTDHAGPCVIDGFENIIRPAIENVFHPHIKVHMIAYWTAIYAEQGYHATHQHVAHPWESIGPNMSSVFYLSDIGVTQFFNPDQNSNDPDIFMQSKIGKFVMFPAHILHRAPPHMNPDEERIVMSANWRVSEAYMGGYWKARDLVVPLNAQHKEFRTKEKPFT